MSREEAILDVPVVFCCITNSGLKCQLIILPTYIYLPNEEKFSLQVLKTLSSNFYGTKV